MTEWTKEQKEAITKDGTNIIVSAGAGSGKTAVLSQRVINKLKNGVNINELLILTFTNAAAYEMKERIRDNIKQDKSLSKQLSLIDTAYITTFDSFALSILKKYHYMYNINPNVSIIDSNIINIEKEKILDQIFHEMYQEKNIPFQKLIKDFCTKSDKEIRKSILNISNKLDMKEDKLRYLDEYMDNYFNDEFINKVIDEYIKIILSKIDSLKNTLSLLKTYSDGNYYEKMEDTVLPLLNSTSYKDIKHNVNITLPRLPNRSSDDLKKIKEDISKLIEDIVKLTKYEDVSSLKEEYLLTRVYVEVIIDIVKKLDVKVKKYKQKYDLYEFNDVAILAIKIIKDNKEIQNELKNSFNEIMVDEYQDTNDLQDIFISLIADNNVYTVGDIKQSIYRFRNANPSNFKAKYDLYKQGLNGYKIDLTKNFRSRKPVLDDINRIFNLIMSDNIGKADYIKEHQMNAGNDLYNRESTNQKYGLQIYNYEQETYYSNLEIEAFIIANDIKNKIKNKYQVFDKDIKKLRDAKLNDFVVLIDRATDFEIFKKIFEYSGIPTDIEKDEDITNEIEVQIIKNLLNLIIKIKNNELDNEFKYYFTSIARSFLFEYSDAMIFEYFKNNNFKNNEIYEKAHLVSIKLDDESISSILNKIISEFDIINNLIKIGKIEERIIRVNYLFNIASSLSKMGYSVYDYANHLTTIINSSNQIKFSLNTTRESSVRITTIHKSKGLEYNICYFPSFDKDFNLSDLKEKFLYDNDYGIITPYFKDGINSTFIKELLTNKYMLEEISEKIRLLYVAFTRARENMIIVTNLKENFLTIKNEFGVVDDNVRMNYRSFNDIIFSIYNNVKDYIINYDLNSIDLTKDYKKIRKVNYKEYIPEMSEKIEYKNIDIPDELLEEKSFSKSIDELIDKDTLDRMEVGTRIHQLLEMIDFTNPDLDKLDITPFYKSILNNFLHSEILSDIKLAKICKEYEFMYEQDKIEYHGIIDLLLEYDDHIDIIDYKLKNIDDVKYIEQLKGYKKYISSLTDKKINIYLYSIIDNHFKLVNI